MKRRSSYCLYSYFMDFRNALSCTWTKNAHCAPHGPSVGIGPQKVLELPVSSSSIVNLKVDVGDVTIIGTDSNQLNARMTIECPGLDSRCANRLADLDWVSSMTGEQLTLTTNKYSAFRLSAVRYRDAGIITRIEIPKVKQVSIEMMAVEIDRRAGARYQYSLLGVQIEAERFSAIHHATCGNQPHRSSSHANKAEILLPWHVPPWVPGHSPRKAS